MPSYFYTGRSMDGREIKGTRKAKDESTLTAELVREGIFIESVRTNPDVVKMVLARIFGRAEITKITRQMGLLLKSEISILEAFELIREEIANRTLAEIFGSVVRDVESGKSVASALSKFSTVFDELYLSMVEAGELSGNLDSAFGRIADYREKSEQITKKVRSAIAYPLLVVLVAVAVVTALIFYVVPVFSSMYENFGADLPSLTKTVVSISSFMTDTVWYWVLLLLVLAGGAVYVSVARKPRFVLHKIFVSVPVLRNLVIKMVSARFCRTMGVLLQSGVDIIYALRVSSRTTGNQYVDSRLQSSELLLSQGRSFTEAVSESFALPRPVFRLSASGEKTGRLGEMLERAADYYERETEVEVGTLTSLIEPVIIIILGVFVAFILIAMYLPLFDLVGTL